MRTLRLIGFFLLALLVITSGGEAQTAKQKKKKAAAAKLAAGPQIAVVGDADAIRPAQTLQFFELLGGGQKDAGWDGSGMSNARLAILPGITHYNIIDSPLLASVITRFLDESMPEGK